MHPPLVKAPAQKCFYSAFNFEALQGTFDISNILSHKQGRYFPPPFLTAPFSCGTHFFYLFPFPLPPFPLPDSGLSPPRPQARETQPTTKRPCLPACMPACLACLARSHACFLPCSLFSLLCVKTHVVFPSSIRMPEQGGPPAALSTTETQLLRLRWDLSDPKLDT